MNLIRFVLALSIALTLLPLMAFADLQPVPEVDPFAQLAALVLQWKTMKPMVLGMSIVIFATQAVKRFMGESAKYKRLIVTALSLVYAILFSVSQGLGAAEAFILVMFTGGGATAIYELLKGMGLLGKAKPVAPVEAPVQA